MTPPRVAALCALSLGILLASECIPTPDPASYVTGLRVLAIKAEPPEIKSGQVSVLNALAFDTLGRMINIAWETCLITPEQGQVVYHFAIGYPVPDPRIVA